MKLCWVRWFEKQCAGSLSYKSQGIMRSCQLTLIKAIVIFLHVGEYRPHVLEVGYQTWVCKGLIWSGALATKPYWRIFVAMGIEMILSEHTCMPQENSYDLGPIIDGWSPDGCFVKVMIVGISWAKLLLSSMRGVTLYILDAVRLSCGRGIK